jgi:hypothetical protein
VPDIGRELRRQLLILEGRGKWDPSRVAAKLTEAQNEFQRMVAVHDRESERKTVLLQYAIVKSEQAISVEHPRIIGDLRGKLRPSPAAQAALMKGFRLMKVKRGPLGSEIQYQRPVMHTIHRDRFTFMNRVVLLSRNDSEIA